MDWDNESQASEQYQEEDATQNAEDFKTALRFIENNIKKARADNKKSARWNETMKNQDEENPRTYHMSSDNEDASGIW